VWPGGSSNKPDGTKWSSKFKIVVIEEKPFVFKKMKPKNVECKQAYNNSVDCPWSYKNFTQNYCCFGYCIDLIRLLSQELNFIYEIYIVPDGLYGDMVRLLLFAILVCL
jgi:ionotropic glutamate receptor NMDA 1